ncbi:MAG: homoserine kinase, partial [Acidimicrobiales bacterium]
SVHQRDGIIVRPLALDDQWHFVVVVPDQELATVDARRVLPSSIPFSDAVHNLSALGFLIAGLGDHHSFVPSSMDDNLHQPYRMSLLPFAEPLLATLREAGAAGSCWSGAGSTMLALCLGESLHDVALAAREFLVTHSVPGTVLTLEADRTGLVVL